VLGTICADILTAMYARVVCPLSIVETGTVFQTYLEPGEVDLRERSTVAIARWIHSNGGAHRLLSIDLDAGHIGTSKVVIQREGLSEYVCWYRGTGVDGLRSIAEAPDFVLLDADSNASTTLEEFDAVWGKMATHGIIVIDDAFKHHSVNKARLTIPEANKRGMKVWELRGQAVAITQSTAAEQIMREVRNSA
jgi:predicted O-methyltransferase YrrM